MAGRRASSVSIAVNVSAVQFRQKSFLAFVRATQKEAKLPPEPLELEITESLLMSNGEATLSVLKELKDMGVGLAIDDFGTGYSRLSFLKRFPVD